MANTDTCPRRGSNSGTIHRICTIKLVIDSIPVHENRADSVYSVGVEECESLTQKWQRTSQICS